MVVLGVLFPLVVRPFTRLRRHHDQIVRLREPVLGVLPDVREQESVNDFLRPAKPVLLDLPRRNELANLVEGLLLALHEQVLVVYHHVVLYLLLVYERVGNRLRSPQAITDAFKDQKEIQNDVMINNENLLVKSEKEALDKIGKFVAPGQVEEYRLRRAQEVIDAFLLPHI